MRDKINRDPSPRTPSLQEFYALLVRRTADLEDVQLHGRVRNA